MSPYMGVDSDSDTISRLQGMFWWFYSYIYNYLHVIIWGVRSLLLIFIYTKIKDITLSLLSGFPCIAAGFTIAFIHLMELRQALLFVLHWIGYPTNSYNQSKFVLSNDSQSTHLFPLVSWWQCVYTYRVRSSGTYLSNLLLSTPVTVLESVAWMRQYHQLSELNVTLYLLINIKKWVY